MASKNRFLLWLTLMVVNISYIEAFFKSNTVHPASYSHGEIKSMDEYEQRLKSVEEVNTAIVKKLETVLEDNRRLSTRLSDLESNDQDQINKASCKEEIDRMSGLVQSYDRRISALENKNRDLKRKMEYLLDTMEARLEVQVESTDADISPEKQQQESEFQANLTESYGKQKFLQYEGFGDLKHNSNVHTEVIHNYDDGEKENRGLSARRLISPSRTSLKRAAGTRSAFSASISHDYHNLGNSQSIVFDHVLINDGKHYNAFTGAYTCPVSGMYVFFLTVTSYGDGPLETAVVRNGELVTLVYSSDDPYLEYNSGSNTAIVQLHVGDTVFVRVHGAHHSEGIYINGYFSSFSGFLLYEI